MMKKKSILMYLMFVSIMSFANDLGNNILKIKKEGSTIRVVDFEEGDVIKLFEYETSDIILKKTRGEVDFFQLAEGRYVLENSQGEKVLLEYDASGIKVLYYTTPIYSENLSMYKKQNDLIVLQ